MLNGLISRFSCSALPCSMACHVVQCNTEMLMLQCPCRNATMLQCCIAAERLKKDGRSQTLYNPRPYRPGPRLPRPQIQWSNGELYCPPDSNFHLQRAHIMNTCIYFCPKSQDMHTLAYDILTVYDGCIAACSV